MISAAGLPAALFSCKGKEFDQVQELCDRRGRLNARDQRVGPMKSIMEEMLL